MHYRLGTISLAATTLLLALTSPLLPIGSFEPLVAQAQTPQDRKAEADRLFQQAYQHFQQKQYEAAIGSLQQALTIYRAISDSPNGDSLASRNRKLRFYSGLVTPTSKWLHLLSELTNLGWGLVKDYSKAIEFYQQALAVYRAIGERNKEAEVLISLGNAYKSGHARELSRG
jgi:tetratricopeptide (TPR) repeat protein